MCHLELCLVNFRVEYQNELVLLVHFYVLADPDLWLLPLVNALLRMRQLNGFVKLFIDETVDYIA